MGRGSVLVAVALASACTFGSPGGKGDSAGSIAGEDTGDDDRGSTSPPGDDGEEDGSAGMSAGTGMANSSATETGAPVDPDDSGSDGPTSTTGVEPSTSGSDGPVDPTLGTGSSDDGGGPDPYPQCGQGGQCPGGSACIGLYDHFGSLSGAYCGEESCGNGTDCAPPSSGNAEPTCVGLDGGGSACALSCENGETCPTGMACIEIPGPELCGWDL